MRSILEFAGEYPYFSIIMVVVNMVLAWPVVRKTSLALNPYVLEATGRKKYSNGAGLYRKGREIVFRYLQDIAGNGIVEKIVRQAEQKLEKAGYHKKGAVLRYLLLRCLLPPLVFIITLKVNYPDIVRPVVAAAMVIVLMEVVIRRGRIKLEKQFNRNAYKIYKYLHNQVSSGISASDAVKTVYEVVSDNELRQALVRMAARYELSKDIESALEELVARFDIHDTHTLCIAIRLGVVTGDNGEMLARQEEIMFKKYFNYIQAETERCRLKSVLSAIFFTAIIIILISVPLLMNVMRSLNNIFGS